MAVNDTLIKSQDLKVAEPLCLAMLNLTGSAVREPIVRPVNTQTTREEKRSDALSPRNSLHLIPLLCRRAHSCPISL